MLRRIHGGAMKMDTPLEKSLSYTSFDKRKGQIRLTERGVDISNYVMSEFLF